MKFITIPALILILALGACGQSKLEGNTYVPKEQGGFLKGTELVFKPNGKVNFMGADMPYEMDGKNVKVYHPNTPDRPLILTPKDDGSFDSTFGNWVKKP